MILYALCLNPLLCTLKKKLPGIRIGQSGPSAKVVAYADDVTIFVTSPADIPIIQEMLRSYEEASGAQVNIRKSKALALGPRDTSLQIMDIPYYNEIRILGFYVTSTVNATARRSWSTLTDRIHAQAHAAYARKLSLDRRIQYVHDYLLAKVWYVAQFFPPPRRVHPDAEYIHLLVSLERGNLSRAPVHSTA
jgi:hypothetical protein